MAHTSSAIQTAPIIYINGYPGVGKQTIARELMSILPYPVKLLDNHLLIDPVAALLDRSSPEYYPLQQRVRSTLLSAIAQSSELLNTLSLLINNRQANSAPLLPENMKMWRLVVALNLSRFGSVAAKRNTCDELRAIIENRAERPS